MDEHYCAAIFRYLREYALQFRSESLLICLDDKHGIKRGEPGFPVAAAEVGVSLYPLMKSSKLVSTTSLDSA